MYAIVGLGNPGAEYEATRHNAGRILLNVFAEQKSFPDWEKDKYADALLSEGIIEGEEVLLVLPETYMNHSGKTMQYLQKTRQIGVGQVIVLYDDLDLPLGSIKISVGRGSGGHNGVASVIDGLGSKEFIRIRIGISPVSFLGRMKRPTGDAAATFVLGQFSKREQGKLHLCVQDIENAIACILTKGVPEAMNKHN